jgi:cytochrome c553
MKKLWLASLTILVAAVILASPWIPGWYWSARTDNPVRRGAKLARTEGCLSCHGPTGRDETANPGSRWGTVPSFFRGNAMMYVKSPEQVETFIAEGNLEGREPAERGGYSSAPRTATSPPFHMRGFKNRLSRRQISDLAAFALAADGYLAPSEGSVAKGSELSSKFGCENCHGVAGSGGISNPHSFTGSVPGWIGPDFDHLVSGKGDFGEWVLKGRSRRWAGDRAASFFLDRANLYMPSFQGTLSDDDVAALWAYVQWLRAEGPAMKPAGKAP